MEVRDTSYRNMKGSENRQGKGQKTKELLKRIEDIFYQKLAAKTEWGRNEVMSVYREAVNDALMEMMTISYD